MKMGSAFKCDACDEYFDGSPRSVQLTKRRPSPFSDTAVWGSADLCSSCYDDLQDELDQFVDDGE